MLRIHLTADIYTKKYVANIPECLAPNWTVSPGCYKLDKERMQEADVSVSKYHFTQAGPQLTLSLCSSSWSMQVLGRGGLGWHTSLQNRRRISSQESTPGPYQPSTACEQRLSKKPYQA
eukprot:7615397-Ditylum_brightwellii.AAC.1